MGQQKHSSTFWQQLYCWHKIHFFSTEKTQNSPANQNTKCYVSVQFRSSSDNQGFKKSDKMNKKRVCRDELGRCSRQESYSLVPKLGRRVLLRSREAFFAGLEEGSRITADWINEDRERVNVTSGSAVPSLTKICRGATSLVIRLDLILFYLSIYLFHKQTVFLS